MAVKIAINGFGRIGRQVTKALFEKYKGDFDLVAVNDLGDVKTNAHLFKYDSNYGVYRGSVEVDGGDIVIDGDRVKVLSERDPSNLPWGDMGVDIVVESTGLFTAKEKASLHLSAGAKKVIISAPAKGEDITICMGVNNEKYDPAKHFVISNASCTTNGLAPVAKVLHERFGIEKGILTTVHAYTASQSILDKPTRKRRRGRAGALSMIPTSTGAAQATALVIPALAGKMDGMAIRVPVPNGSVTDIVAELERPTDAAAVNACLRAAASIPPMAGILAVSDDELVSVDIIGNPHSAIVDALSTNVLNGTMVKLLSWYDNEWGYACRLAELAGRL